MKCNFWMELSSKLQYVSFGRTASYLMRITTGNQIKSDTKMNVKKSDIFW